MEGDHGHGSLTMLFAFVAVEAFVFGTLGLDVIPSFGSAPAMS